MCCFCPEDTANKVAEAAPNSGAKIVQKTWNERLNDEPELESDADEQLLMYIPYVDTFSVSF